MDELDLGATIKGLSPGQKVFARYTLRRILGRGGMGVVWLARDEELEREVALKFLPEVVALDRESIAELKKETRRNLGLTHANIVRVHDFIQGPATAAISMEYVEGASLSALKLEQPGNVFTLAQVRPWLEQLGAALDYAHGSARIVHRDVKPANLMVGSRGELKVTDFGIARSVADSVSRVSAHAGSSGTPVYMSPQQMLGEDPAVTDDIYAVGATLYELLTGKPPFHSGNILLQVQSKVPAPLNARRAALGLAPDIPQEWEQTIADCLAKEPGARPPQVKTLLARLQSPSAPRAVVAASAAASAAAGALPPRPARPAGLPDERVRANRRIALVIFGAAAAVGLIYFGTRPEVLSPEEAAAIQEQSWARKRQLGDFTTEVVTSFQAMAVAEQPILVGRRFIPADFAPAGAPVFHLSATAWEYAFGRDPAIIGRRITVYGHGEGTVVGVVEVPAQVGASTEVFVAQRAAPAPAS